jgi:Lipase maturation factor
MASRLSHLFQVNDDYRLASWLFLRGLALVYFFAFASLAVQIDGLAGPNGLLPFHETLSNAYREIGWHAWWRIPTVFWLDASDTALRFAAYGGCILAVMLFFGRQQMLALIGMFVLYLSLFHAGDTFLSFQWDTLLMEAGFLAIFLVRGPTGLVIFMYHWLLFRFRFMSGFFKLYSDDPSWSGLTTLNYYFETQVLPHAGAWYFHQLPEWMLKGGVLLVFFTELIVPFFIFLPRRFRIAAAIITIGMQLLIMATSNHNFVNLLVIILCLFLLDDRIVGRILPAGLKERLTTPAPTPGMSMKAVLGVASVLIFTSSITTFAWRTTPVNYPDFLNRTFVTVHTYGLGHIFHVYPSMQTERQELEIQGSYDGQNWYSYGFKYKPGPLNKRPTFNIPHQPRLDWMMWFIPPQGKKDDYWFQMLLRRLHEGSPQVIDLLEYNPFEKQPPRYLRVLAFDYRFTTPEEREATGNWWKRQYLGEFPNVRPRVP